MRNLNELYTAFLEFYLTIEVVPFNTYNKYICNAMHLAVNKGIMTTLEHQELYNHFQSQRPTEDLHSEFIIDIYTNTKHETDPWWYMTLALDEGVKVREEFLTKMISITK